MFITTFLDLLAERCHDLYRGNISNHFLHTSTSVSIFKRFHFESLQETIHDKNHASVLLPCIINSLLGNKANIIHQPFSVLRPTVYLMHKKLYFRFFPTVPLSWHSKKKKLSSVFNLQSTERNSRLYFVRFQPLNCLQLLGLETFLLN